jgi:NAD(P)-dependent dehydrogenase (short-subunit alcohol dehydrogenase family)
MLEDLFDSCYESSEGIEYAYALNHLAGFLLTLSLYPSLKRAPHSRVLIVSSHVQNVRFIRDYAALVQPKYDWSRTYAQTKLRALITSRVLAECWKNAAITVNSFASRCCRHGIDEWDGQHVHQVRFWVRQAFSSCLLRKARGLRSSLQATRPLET